jgi:hypothetical protein
MAGHLRPLFRGQNVRAGTPAFEPAFSPERDRSGVPLRLWLGRGHSALDGWVRPGVGVAWANA